MHEGYYNFNWMLNWGSRIVFLVHVLLISLTLIALTFLVKKIFLNKLLAFRSKISIFYSTLFHNNHITGRLVYQILPTLVVSKI